MQLHELIDTLTNVVAARFDVLNKHFVRDIMADLREEIENELDGFYGIRYVLIDPETGQLESRQLFESEEEAQEAAKKPEHGCPNIAVMLN